MSIRHVNRGFSMVELMVAMVLGLILMGGVMSVFITSKKSYASNNALAQVQQNGRFSLHELEYPIRQAGYFGCAHNVVPQSILTSTTASYYDNNAIEGYEANGTGVGATLTITLDKPTAATSAASWTPNLPGDIATDVGIGGTQNQAIAGSDIIVLHEAVPGGVSLTNPYQDSSGLFVGLGQGALLNINGIYVVTDCHNSGIFQVTNIANNYNSGNHDRVDHSSNSTMNPGNASPAHFNSTFGAGSQIYAYQTYIFYVGIGKDGGPSLFEVSMGSAGTIGPAQAQEIVSGVESMQLLYGVDTDGDQVPNQYVTAANVTNWTQVVSVRIGLLTRSDSNATDSKPLTSFVLLDPTAADGLTINVPATTTRLREVYDETVSIRNRLP